MTDPVFSKDMQDLVATLVRQRAPVIVTFGELGEVMDTSGDLAYYADCKDTLVEMLSDLLVGWQEPVGSIVEVQMPSGRHADIRIVPEGVMRHMVLFDAAGEALELREVLQASHELALRERRRRVSLERQYGLSGDRLGVREAGDMERHRLEVVETLSWDFQARLDEIRGHAQVLDDGVAKPSAQAHAISCIKRASMHLQALAWACHSSLQGSCTHDAIGWEPLDVKHLVKELESQFGEGPQLQRVCFEVDYRLGSIELASIEHAAVYQILVGLITGVLDATRGTLSIRVFLEHDQLVADVLVDRGAGKEDCGLRDLPKDLRYPATHQLVSALGGRLVCSREPESGVRLELPLSSGSPAGHGDEDHWPPLSTTILVAIDDSRLRKRVLDQLSCLGLNARTCGKLEEVEDAAVAAGVEMIILGGEFAGATGIGLSYRLHAAGVKRRMLLLRPVAGLGASAWVFDGRRTIISPDADADVLRAAIEGALRI